MKKAFVIIGIINLLRLAAIPFINALWYNWQPNQVNLQSIIIPETIMQHLYAGFSFITKGNNNILQLLLFAISILTQWSLLVLINKIIRSNRTAKAWVAVSATLLITIFSIFPLTDGLVSLFWLLTLLAFYNAIFNNDKKYWLISGLFMGFTNLLKLSGVALPIGLLVFLIFSSKYRKHLFKSGPYISIVLAAIISLPVWLGIIKTESAGVAINFANNIFAGFGYSFNSFTTFVLFQFLLIFPVLYAGLWWVTFKYLARIFDKPNQVNAEFWFLLSFFLPLFLGFHLTAMFDWVDMMGLAPIYLTGLIVFLKLSKPRWFVVNTVFAILFHIVFIISLVFS